MSQSFTTQRKVVIVSHNIFNQKPCKTISNMSSCTKGNLNKGHSLTSISFCKKMHVEKLDYTVKFEKAA